MDLNNNYVIPSIGLGTYPYKEALEISLPFAINKENVRMIDASDNYGNEEFVGKGLRNVDLTNVVVVSKFSQPHRTHELEKCYEESKKTLGALNIYLLHWPYPYLWKKQWRKMEDMYLAGKCDAIGVCNFDMGYMKELLSFCRVKPTINQFERHPLFQQQELVDFCHENDIAVMAYSPVARMDKDLQESEVLKRLSAKYDKTINQIILRWDIDTSCIPIPASSSEKHIHENFNIFDFALEKEEIEAINRLERGKRIRFNPRSRFSIKQRLMFLKYKLKMRFLGIM